jgi:hypothetical protein
MSGSGFSPFCRNNVISLCLISKWLNFAPAVGVQLECATAWVLVKVKVIVYLTRLEAWDRGWNFGFPSLLWHSAHLGENSCQLHALSSQYSWGNYLAVISVRGWMDRKGYTIRRVAIFHFTNFQIPLIKWATPLLRKYFDLSSITMTIL